MRLPPLDILAAVYLKDKSRLADLLPLQYKRIGTIKRKKK